MGVPTNITITESADMNITVLLVLKSLVLKKLISRTIASQMAVLVPQARFLAVRHPSPLLPLASNHSSLGVACPQPCLTQSFFHS